MSEVEGYWDIFFQTKVYARQQTVTSGYESGICFCRLVQSIQSFPLTTLEDMKTFP